MARKKKSGFSILRVLGSVVYIGVAAAIVIGVAWRMDLLHKQAAAAKKADPDRTVTEDATLFVNLLEAKLLVPRADTGLDMAAKDYVLVRRATGDTSDEDEGISPQEQENLLKELYDSAPGRIVQNQVRLWNETRRLAGIRDSRPAGREAAGRVEWRAETESGHPLRLGASIPETFGFIHKDTVSTGYGDWVGVSTDSRRVVFKTQPRGATELLIQVVGDPVIVPPGARVEKRDLNFADVKAQWPCRISARTALVRIPVRGDAEIAIAVEPAANCAPRIFGLAVSMTGEDLSGAPRAKKRKGKKGRPGAKEPGKVTIDTVEWSYAWRPVARATRTAESRFVIKTADGVNLTDPTGRGTPTAEAHELGLLALVGFGRNDAGSVAGMLAQSRLPPSGIDVSLTIDSRYQKIVQSTVAHYATKVFAGNKFDSERRVAITLVDADTGAVLAIGGWPQPPANAQPWDYVSFAVSQPLRDPMSVQAWELIDKHNVPGSTWKTLLSLSAIIDGNPRAAQMIRGLPPAEFQSVVGISTGTGTYQIPGSTRSISNHGGGGMAVGAPAGDTNHCKNVALTSLERNAEFGQNDGKLGIKQAVLKSYNVYFSRLATLIEEADVDKWIAGLPRDRRGYVRVRSESIVETHFMKRLKVLRIDHEDRMDLAWNVAENLGLARLKTRTGADALYAPGPLTHISRGEALLPDAAANWRVAAMHRIALNGIGQGWSVSTLHLATGASAIATGRVIKPHVLLRWGDRALPNSRSREEMAANEIAKDADRRELLRLLRLGMKAVPEGPGSTAVGTFMGQVPRIANGQVGGVKAVTTVQRAMGCRTYGKTGTADVARGLGYNSGWFIGFKDPAKPGGRRLAFGCMTSHVMIAGLRFGGASCGQMMRDILFSVETAIEAPDVEAREVPREPGERPPADEGEGTSDE